MTEKLTTWGLTESEIIGQEATQPPAPTETKGEQPYTNYIPKGE